MAARDPDEAERAATPLELFFDLCFVVAIAQASSKLHHAVADGHAGSGIVGTAGVMACLVASMVAASAREPVAQP